MTAPAMTAAGDMQFAQPPPLPMLTLDDGASEFDYGAFLQDEDVDYLAEDSSASSHTLNDSSPPALNAQPSTSVVNSGSSSNQRQRLERRGHTKSRRGCFNCKRRRIKVGRPRADDTPRSPHYGTGMLTCNCSVRSRDLLVAIASRQG